MYMAVAQDVHQAKVCFGHLLIGDDVIKRDGQRHLQGDIQCILRRQSQSDTEPTVHARVILLLVAQSNRCESHKLDLLGPAESALLHWISELAKMSAFEPIHVKRHAQTAKHALSQCRQHEHGGV